ncbi:MAG TPA: GerMN domain-containing protein [Candidatus Cryosericum sp.]|nr:GerMN domain-containing protein [Candidatus Cryosericum sp.]
MTMRGRHGTVSRRKHASDGGWLVLVLALALAFVVGSSFRTAAGRSVSVVLYYTDSATGELIRTPTDAKLPTRLIEEVAGVIDLLRVPPAGQDLATVVPAGLTARRATLDANGILRVGLGIGALQRPMGFAEENTLYWQLANSFLSLPGVRSIELSVEGRPAGTFLSFVKTQRELGVNESMLERGQAVDLYFATTDGRMAVESRTVPPGLTRSQLALQTMRALMQGPAHSSLLPLPLGTDLLRGVTVSARTASVDFVSRVQTLSMGAGEEQRTLDMIVLTLTRLPGISRVRFLVAGNPVDVLFGHVDTSGPLFRLDGRVEAGTALTVYRLADIDGEHLPVLTIMEKDPPLEGRNAMISSIIAALASSAEGDSSLVPPHTSVTSMLLDTSTGTLHLALNMSTVPEQLGQEALMVEQLRLSLTEIPLVTSLRLTINGSVSFLPGGYYIGRLFAR